MKDDTNIVQDLIYVDTCHTTGKAERMITGTGKVPRVPYSDVAIVIFVSREDTMHCINSGTPF